MQINQKYHRALMALMRIFAEAIDITTKPRFDANRVHCINAKLGGEHNSLRKNVYKYFSKMMLIVITL